MNHEMCKAFENDKYIKDKLINECNPFKEKKNKTKYFISSFFDRYFASPKLKNWNIELWMD